MKGEKRKGEREREGDRERKRGRREGERKREGMREERNVLALQKLRLKFLKHVHLHHASIPYSLGVV